MLKYLISLSYIITSVIADKSRGYYCPYSDLGIVGGRDLLFDAYTSSDGGITNFRLGETGFITRESYCESITEDLLCTYSMGVCQLNQGVCSVLTTKEPDCIELCQAILDGSAPDCDGPGCPPGTIPILSLYALCEEPFVPETPQQQPTTEPTTDDTPPLLEITTETPVQQPTHHHQNKCRVCKA